MNNVNFVVLYRDDALLPADPPFAFTCFGDNDEHAEEQCENAYPGCDIVHVYVGNSVPEAYAEYWA